MKIEYAAFYSCQALQKRGSVLFLFYVIFHNIYLRAKGKKVACCFLRGIAHLQSTELVINVHTNYINQINDARRCEQLCRRHCFVRAILIACLECKEGRLVLLGYISNPFCLSEYR